MPWGSLRDPPDACLPSPAPCVCRQTPRDDMAGLPAPWLQAALAEDKRLTAVRGASPRVSKVWLRLHRRSRPHQSCFLPPPGPPDVLVTSCVSPPAGLGWGRALLSQPWGHSLSCAFPTVHRVKHRPFDDLSSVIGAECHPLLARTLDHSSALCHVHSAAVGPGTTETDLEALGAGTGVKSLPFPQKSRNSCS